MTFSLNMKEWVINKEFIMFEKDSEDYVNKDTWLFETAKQDAKYHFQQGAEFGYNKANEWHYVKDELPPCGEDVLLYYGVDIMGKVVVSTGCIDCHGTWYKNIDETPIMWQSINLPKD